MKRIWILWEEAWHDGSELFQSKFLDVTGSIKVRERWKNTIAEIEEIDPPLEGMYRITELPLAPELKAVSKPSFEIYEVLKEMKKEEAA